MDHLINHCTKQRPPKGLEQKRLLDEQTVSWLMREAPFYDLRTTALHARKSTTRDCPCGNLQTMAHLSRISSENKLLRLRSKSIIFFICIKRKRLYIALDLDPILLH